MIETNYILVTAKTSDGKKWSVIYENRDVQSIPTAIGRAITDFQESYEVEIIDIRASRKCLDKHDGDL